MVGGAVAGPPGGLIGGIVGESDRVICIHTHIYIYTSKRTLMLKSMYIYDVIYY